MTKETQFTVGDYLAERLSQIGIINHFVVPGDYNLKLLDYLEYHPKLSEIGCCNELNCAFAAEGYARAHGISAAVVTYSVGALTAFDGIGGAYAENLPVILISGAPNTNDLNSSHILHHTTGTHNFDYQMDIAKNLTVAAVALRRANEAPRLIDHALRQAVLQHKPVYIEVPTNMATQPCPKPGPISAVIEPETSDKASLEQATDVAADLISKSEKPIMLAGPKIRAAGAEKAFLKLAGALDAAVVVQPNAKSFISEEYKNYAGVYWGLCSTRAADKIGDFADFFIGAGTVFNDYTSNGYKIGPSAEQFIDSDYMHVSLPGYEFTRVKMDEFLSRLADKVSKKNATMVEYARIKPALLNYAPANPKELLTREELMRQIQGVIDGNTTLYAETGDSWFNGMQMNLPEGAKFEIEMQWGHIGWSVPSALGYAIAAPKRRTVIMVGDGSFQLTGQELAQMVLHKLPVIIFLINNRGYTIEIQIHDGPYNRIKNWDYAAFMESFNAEDGKAKGLKANTGEELDQAIQIALANKEGPTLIECYNHTDDCTKELVAWGSVVGATNARAPAADQ
ncbi:pyruvate decarboxylase [Schizosaccharomyces osmophilus]|uniref:pyruvate decarboxylase n=1 Tax=Schizosaccharomyces osmophilus TaxID=2545709 RepID=A0AAE9WCU5_9SCHI|nr:pyruvate decarboxylase [Schizosaccharomyces osmophilus]WBW74062.1 pyruvate decarboxylase [Schizosaccharomyces osmophilus]